MSVEKDIEELAALKVSAPHDIKIHYLDYRGRKTTKLVGNTSEENYVKGQHRTYEFELKEPQFISRIQISTLDYIGGDKASFTYTCYPSGNKIETQVANTNNAWNIRVNESIKKFSIEPPRRYLGDQFLTAVQIEGVRPSEFLEIAKQVGAVENLRQSAFEKCRERLEAVAVKETEVDGLNQKISELTDSINELNGCKSEIDGELESSQEKLAATDRSVESKKQELSEYSVRIESAASSIEQKTEERKQLSAEIAKAKVSCAS